jgi:hypothetical protein
MASLTRRLIPPASRPSAPATTALRSGEESGGNWAELWPQFREIGRSSEAARLDSVGGFTFQIACWQSRRTCDVRHRVQPAFWDILCG